MVSVILSSTLTEEEKTRREELLSRPEYADLYPWRAALAKKATAQAGATDIQPEEQAKPTHDS